MLTNFMGAKEWYVSVAVVTNRFGHEANFMYTNADLLYSQKRSQGGNLY